MLGGYRFLLAILVALSHFGFIYKGLNPGQWAVISFYFLSGYLMWMQFGKFNAQKELFGASMTFYIDRFLRIFPLYLIVLSFMYLTLGGVDHLENYLLFPLSYHSLLGVKAEIFPAWSLATEMHFYILVPFLFLASNKILKSVMWLSFMIFIISPFLSNSTWWGYYGAPGTLFVFAAGMMFAKGLNIKPVLFASIVALAGFVIAKTFQPALPCGINISVCLGMIFAALVVPVLSKLKGGKWDKNLGALTFPLFLIHPWVVEFFNFDNMLFLLLTSLVISWALMAFIENPFDKLRYAVRKILLGKSTSYSKTTNLPPET
ncbi:acyltransferase [Methylobacillus gramineus]|uniref:acyltransferase family protein n=1 Tax=Methylobacillus gramineus TaxID=755169 RepID=UPI001CFFBA11|nr:acyltransferase [Methylobacillus gramineus]MCB5183701.1 acyltransferase [Methylobacillus gramineus]